LELQKLAKPVTPVIMVVDADESNAYGAENKASGRN
jgi:hypothetical protein